MRQVQRTLPPSQTEEVAAILEWMISRCSPVLLRMMQVDNTIFYLRSRVCVLFIVVTQLQTASQEKPGILHADKNTWSTYL